MLGVPNVPCGVERDEVHLFRGESPEVPVPNVPCGVERVFDRLLDVLMTPHVPNVPCGVERDVSLQLAITGTEFLMYRVELKACKPSLPTFLPRCS